MTSAFFPNGPVTVQASTTDDGLCLTVGNQQAAHEGAGGAAELAQQRGDGTRQRVA